MLYVILSKIGKKFLMINFHFLYNFSWHLRFLQSEFKGQLPKPYYPGPDSTSTIPSHMNNINKEEPTRYVSYYI